MVSSPARQVHVESAPEVQVPAPMADGPAGADPAAGDGSDTGDGPETRNGPATGNDPATGDGSATGDGPTTGDGSATGDGPATGEGPATGDDPASDDPADVLVVESSHNSELQFDEPDESDGPARHPAEGVDGSAGHGLMEPRQQPRQGVDQTSPCLQGPAARFSLPSRDPSIRQRW